MGTITAMSSDLTAALVKMRRNPLEFTVLRTDAKCKFCYKKTAVDIGHPLNPQNAGCWCPEHGWLVFDSVAIPPTERLKPHEVQEREEAEKRRIAWQKRQAKAA